MEAKTVNRFLRPGVSLAEGARTLADPARRKGTYAYQWLFPGPNSKHVAEGGSAAMPGSYTASAVLVSYQVPQGYRFSLRGLVMTSNCPDWTEGSGDLLFDLFVTDVGARKVEFFGNVDTRRGSSLTPWPILGRLEFQSLSTLSMVMTPVANVSLGVDGGFGTGILVGHIYPNAEAGEG